jgi:hypothetical protein
MLYNFHFASGKEAKDGSPGQTESKGPPKTLSRFAIPPTTAPTTSVSLLVRLSCSWNLPPLMIRAFGAHCQKLTHALQ